MPNRVVHFEIEAEDPKRASKFYSDAFGWTTQEQGDQYSGYIVVQSGPAMPDPKDWGINGGIFKADGDKKLLNAFRCVIGVEDIDKAVADVKAAGGKVEGHILNDKGEDMGEKVEIPGIGTWAKCEDTEGNLFSVLQPSPDMTSK